MPDLVPDLVPPGWEVVDTAVDGTVLIAREPVGPELGRFRANLVHTAVTLAGLDFRSWQQGTDELLPRVLHDYLLVDLERLDVGPRRVGRRLAHHVAADGAAVTMEQWFTGTDDVGHTLTATVETWRYDELADLCATAAATWLGELGVS